jgi:hypothetical protein
MKNYFHLNNSMWLCCLFCLAGITRASAQTETDAIMMNRNQFCSGLIYTYSSWDQYWEGTLKRENLNLGTVSTQAVMYMANYGIRDNLNVMVAAPYVWTKASAGTLHGLNGVQDVSLFVKWKPISKSFGKSNLSLFVVGGLSTPLTDYVIDFLPMSIGLGSTNLSARGIIDYYHKDSRLFATGSAAYVWRSNVELDRDNYYTTELILSNEVEMPNAATYNLRAGYRGQYLIAEAQLVNWTTLGGFDITKNNMPFPSNRMNATSVGVDFKYTIKKHTNLSILGGVNYTIHGRNVGQALSYNAGAFYAFYFGKKKK